MWKATIVTELRSLMTNLRRGCDNASLTVSVDEIGERRALMDGRRSVSSLRLSLTPIWGVIDEDHVYGWCLKKIEWRKGQAIYILFKLVPIFLPSSGFGSSPIQVEHRNNTLLWQTGACHPDTRGCLRINRPPFFRPGKRHGDRIRWRGPNKYGISHNSNDCLEIVC